MGRISWAVGSDYIGRKNTMLAFGVLGAPAALSLPYFAQWVLMLLDDVAIDPAAQVSTDPSVTPLYGFCAVSGLMITTYGGLLAVRRLEYCV